MRLVTYEIEHKSGLGVISRDGSWVYPLASLDMDYKTSRRNSCWSMCPARTHIRSGGLPLLGR